MNSGYYTTRNEQPSEKRRDLDERFYGAELTFAASEQDADVSPLLSDSVRKNRTLKLKSAVFSKREYLRDTFKKVNLATVRRIGRSLSIRKVANNSTVDDHDDASMDSSLNSENSMIVSQESQKGNPVTSISSEPTPPSTQEFTVVDGDILFDYTAMGCNRSEPSLRYSLRSTRTSSSHQQDSPSCAADTMYSRRTSCSQFEPSLEFSIRSDPGARFDHLVVNESLLSKSKKVRKSKQKKSKKNKKGKSSGSKKNKKEARIEGNDER
jgi:hypothetical protein